MTKLEKLWGAPGKSARDLAKNQRSQELLSSNLVVSLKGSTRVLVRPIGLDMVEVGDSNPPGPTKFLSICFYEILFFRIARFGVFLFVDATAER